MSDQAFAKGHEMPKHGEICWTEIATTDLEKADSFYSELFGWNIKSDNNPEFEYRHFSDCLARNGFTGRARQSRMNMRY